MRACSLASLVLAAAALAACVTSPTAYAPAAAQGGFGFSEQRIERDRFIVRFQGNSATSADAVRTLALRRAAEVTLGEGYDWFEVVSRSEGAEGAPRSGPSVGVGVGGGSGGSFGSVGVSLPLGQGGGVETQAALEILLRRGPAPAGAPDAYDARSVLLNIPVTGR